MNHTANINARSIFISDLHLGYKDCKADFLLDFLDQIHCESLYLVGDIVDLWALKRRFCWPHKHYQVLMKLYELAENGTRVIYVPGNHDDPMRRFNGDHFGSIEIHRECEHTTADGKNFLVMHGDAMDAYFNFNWLDKLVGDHAYDLLLFINRWSNRVRKWCGRPYFSLSKLIKKNIKGARKAIHTYESHSIREARQRGFDGVICGHIHSPAMKVEEGIHYCNTGDWIENCTALTEDYSGKMRLLHYSDRIIWSDTVEPLTAEPTLNAA